MRKYHINIFKQSDHPLWLWMSTIHDSHHKSRYRVQNQFNHVPIGTNLFPKICFYYISTYNLASDSLPRCVSTMVCLCVSMYVCMCVCARARAPKINTLTKRNRNWNIISKHEAIKFISRASSTFSRNISYMRSTHVFIVNMTMVSLITTYWNGVYRPIEWSDISSLFWVNPSL
jgi:hypothetical protein